MRQQPQKVWQYQKPDIDLSLTLAAELGISPLVARLLVNRDIKTVAEGKTYLYPTYADLHSPFKMADMAKAVERIHQAKKKGEQICIYGDYDADGTTATALLVNAFRYIDFPVSYYIPDRFREGYGLNKDAIKKIHENGCKLLITVDCGITSIEEIEYANELGIDVILTDHHQPPESDPPPAYALISPKVAGNEYPYAELAGVGLAFKLAQGLLDDESYLTSLLDLVVLGTVVDIAPLTGENRTLSRLGLAEINKKNRIGIQKLCEVADISDKPLVGTSLSYRLGPRLNAAGRLKTAKTVVELLTTDSNEKAEKYANDLDQYNQDRKDIENKIQESAVAHLNKNVNLEQTKGLVVASDSWGEHAKGVVGIVASRLLEQYYRPIFVLAIDGDEATGSGRCIEGMNLADSLNNCANLLIKHGGHEAAAGVTLKTENLPKFKKAFNDFACEHLDDEDLIPKLPLDFETNLSALTLQTLEQFNVLEPFGGENPSPRFVTKELTIKGQPSTMGKEQEHLSMYVSDGFDSKRSIGWRKAQHLITLSRPNISLDIAFSPEINDYNNNRSVQLVLDEFHIKSPDRSPNLLIYPPTDIPSYARVVDIRNQNKKESLLTLLNKDKPCIIYVLNTEKTDQLLTSVIPEMVSIIGKHDGTTTKQEELELLEKVKNGRYRGIVSSSTFSASALETVPIIGNIIFCHLDIQPDDFFEKCRPAAKNHSTTMLNLLYNQDSDEQLLKEWVDNTYPDRKYLATLYQKLGETNSTEITDFKTLTERIELNSDQAVELGLTIFEELGLIERNSEPGQQYISLIPNRKSNLERSKTYLKCEWLKQNSQKFAKFQLHENTQQIWERIKDECGIPG